MKFASHHIVKFVLILLPFVDPAGASCPPAPVRIVVSVGQQADGTPTAHWLAAVRRLRGDDVMDAIAGKRRPFNADEQAWLELIASRLDDWACRTPALQAPFGAISPPTELELLVGNNGAFDAFIVDDTVIGFDVEQLHALYGSASEDINGDRIDRFFAHEYMHILHRAWRREHGLELRTPLERALWACLTEGLGNYHSLSARWTTSDGSLSGHAKKALARLGPVFVARLRDISTADESGVDALMAGLSMGSFEEKWGALPVALWLADEVRRDEDALAAWIARGPWGVLSLARRHLPAELAAQLPERPP